MKPPPIPTLVKKVVIASCVTSTTRSPSGTEPTSPTNVTPAMVRPARA